MRRRLWSRVVLGLLILFFALGVGVQMLDSGPAGVDGSVASSEAKGRRALLLLLNELGVEAQAWRGAPNTLPQGPNLLWLADTPDPLGGEEDDSDEVVSPSVDPDDPRPIHADPRHPLNYGVFVRAGGTLVVPYSARRLAWLRESAGLDLPDWPRARLGGDARIELEGGEALRLALSSGVAGTDEEPTLDDGQEGGATEGEDEEAAFDADAHLAAGWHDVAWLADERPFASWTDVGYGRVAFVADDRFLRNDRLRSFDNGLAAVRLVEALSPGGRVLFDEYALGLWVPLSKTELLTSGGLLEIALHAVLLFLLVAWGHAWVREFPRDPIEPSLNPRLRVQSQAALFERARAFDPLAEDLRRGVLERLTRRLGVRRRVAGAERPRQELVGALRERAPLFASDARWNLFRPDAVEGRGQLEALGEALAAFEIELLAESASAPRP